MTTGSNQVIRVDLPVRLLLFTFLRRSSLTHTHTHTHIFIPFQKNRWRLLQVIILTSLGSTVWKLASFPLLGFDAL